MKIAKIFGIALAAVVLLAIAAIAVVATVFDPNDYKAQVAALVEQRTGRTLALDGDLELSYFPWLAVTIGHGNGRCAGFRHRRDLDAGACRCARRESRSSPRGRER